MLIRGDRRHRSILPFPETWLPSLTVVIGVNGSGKTHFLKALSLGDVYCDRVHTLRAQPLTVLPGVVLLKYGEVDAKELGEPAHSTRFVEKRERMGNSRQQTPDFLKLRRQILSRSVGALETLLASNKTASVNLYNALSDLEPYQLADKYGARDKLEQIARIYAEAERSLLNGIEGSEPDVLIRFRNSLSAASRAHKKPARLVTEEEFYGIMESQTVPAFRPQIAKVFSAYRDRQFLNFIARGKGESSALSDAEFAKRYGDPPWDLLSSLLRDFGLDLSVAPPSDEITEPATFELRRPDGQSIPYADLSSGEQILAHFAISLVRFDPLRVIVTLPRLLLLDEMDASLHPEMAARWLEKIRDVLVERHKIAVILTTHSPTTAALAPEESLYELKRGDVPPKKVTKQQAIDSLTAGLPMLSVDFSGRRTVFVESDVDAKIFGKLGEILKNDLRLSRSLNFVSTGMRTTEGREENTGADIVNKIVRELDENKSVFGLVDWDGKIRPNTGRVYVLGQGSHYALDNILLDPLLVCALLLRDNPDLETRLFPFQRIGLLNAGELQHMADFVQEQLDFSGLDAELEDSFYFDAPALKVARGIRQLGQHRLDHLYFEKIPKTRKYKEGSGFFMDNVTNKVLRGYPQFCPQPIVDILRTLSS